MMNFLTTIFHLFSGAPSAPQVSPSPSAVVVTPSNSPAATASPDLNHFTIHPDNTYTDAEKAEQILVEAKINEVVQGPCFEDYLLHKRSRLEQTNGQSPAQVVAFIRQSKASVNITMYTGPNNVVGYTYLGSGTIHTNVKFYRQDSRYRGICPKASNELHEISHVLGYTHDYKATERRPFSIPYSLNSMMNTCCKESP